MGFNLLPHVVVGVPEDELHRACAVLGVEVVRRPAQVLLAGLEPGPVMVAEDVVQLRLRLAALHVVEVVETLIPLGVVHRNHRLHENIGDFRFPPVRMEQYDL